MSLHTKLVIAGVTVFIINTSVTLLLLQMMYVAHIAS